MKRQPTEWEKIFANHISDMGLVSKIYEELIELTSKTNKQKPDLINKLSEVLNRHFSKEDMELANRHMKRCANHQSLVKCKYKSPDTFRLAIIKR